MHEPHVRITHPPRPKPTDCATALKEALEKRGVKVFVEPWDGHKHVDLEIPAIRLDVEVDGLHHLTRAEQILTDLARGFYSHKDGYHTMHIPNEMVDKYLDQIAGALAEAVKIRNAKKIHAHVG